MGLQPLEPGCTRVRIHPQPASLKWARATIPTLLGPVHIRLRITRSGQPRIRVRAPRGMTVQLGEMEKSQQIYRP